MRSVQRVAAVAGALVFTAANPALAQVDLSGEWVMIGQQSLSNQFHGALPGDFTGIPLNKEGRAAAYAFNPEALEQLQRQCQPWSVQYLVNGPFGMRVSTQNDPHSGKPVALRIAAILDRMEMTVWLDGRTAPPEALHTFAGFTTGVWRGATLVTTTTHIKDGFVTRNGVPNSSQETFRMFITRHGELLTITGIVHDPVYLSAPYPWTETYRLNVTGMSSPLLGSTGMQCLPEETIAGLSDGYHTSTYLPGQNPQVDYMFTTYGIPVEASRGGEETMLPAFQRKLAKGYKRPIGECQLMCCGAEGSNPAGTMTTSQPKDCKL